MSVVVRTTALADTQATAVDAWWVENRPAAPTLFSAELAGGLALLAITPDIGRRYRRRSIPGLRRLLLPGSRYHVYYVHDAEAGEVLVLAVWSAVKGRGPHL
jgi:plasmid stabilization system protein ParE